MFPVSSPYGDQRANITGLAAMQVGYLHRTCPIRRDPLSHCFLRLTVLGGGELEGDAHALSRACAHRTDAGEVVLYFSERRQGTTCNDRSRSVGVLLPVDVARLWRSLGRSRTALTRASSLMLQARGVVLSIDVRESYEGETELRGS